MRLFVSTAHLAGQPPLPGTPFRTACPTALVVLRAVAVPCAVQEDDTTTSKDEAIDTLLLATPWLAGIAYLAGATALHTKVAAALARRSKQNNKRCNDSRLAWPCTHARCTCQQAWVHGEAGSFCLAQAHVIPSAHVHLAFLIPAMCASLPVCSPGAHLHPDVGAVRCPDLPLLEREGEGGGEGAETEDATSGSPGGPAVWEGCSHSADH